MNMDNVNGQSVPRIADGCERPFGRLMQAIVGGNEAFAISQRREVRRANCRSGRRLIQDLRACWRSNE